MTNISFKTHEHHQPCAECGEIAAAFPFGAESNRQKETNMMKIQHPDKIRERLATEIGRCLRGGCSATVTDDLGVYAGHDGCDVIVNRVVIHRFQAGRFRLTRANLLAAADEAIERAEEIKAYGTGIMPHVVGVEPKQQK